MSRGAALLALLLLPAIAHGAKPKAKSADDKPPVIKHQVIKDAPLGQAIVIKAEILDDSEIFAPSVQFRPKGSKEYDSIELKKGPGGFTATIPAEQVNADLEYFIEAFDEVGNGPARAGSPESPLSVSVFDPSKGPPKRDDPALVAAPPPPVESSGSGVLGEWWFWGIVAVAVAGGATAVYFGTRQTTVSAVDITVKGPDPAGGM